MKPAQITIALRNHRHPQSTTVGAREPTYLVCNGVEVRHRGENRATRRAKNKQFRKHLKELLKMPRPVAKAAPAPEVPAEVVAEAEHVCLPAVGPYAGCECVDKQPWPMPEHLKDLPVREHDDPNLALQIDQDLKAYGNALVRRPLANAPELVLAESECVRTVTEYLPGPDLSGVVAARDFWGALTDAELAALDPKTLDDAGRAARKQEMSRRRAKKSRDAKKVPS